MSPRNLVRWLATFTVLGTLLTAALAQPPGKGEHRPQGKGPMHKGPMHKGAMHKGAMQKGPMHKGMDKEFIADRDTFHFLLTNHGAIKRTVKTLGDGVETVTESDRPEVAKKIQEHVPAMYKRLKTGNGVRYWDPLFAEAFKHGNKIKMTMTMTDKGIKVVETSDDPEVVRIIQAHADVVTAFVAKGFDEAHEEHPLPPKDKDGKKE